ncbi:MAG TPA: tetratricopeptide repeat protein [Dissulfurispiraceae bacterium]|nr:tetratricopeptide repeat protein [Dissulfurispiraceae bacterium]
MHTVTADELFRKGLEALAGGRMIPALASFEKALDLEDNPAFYSYFALCIAKERGQVRRAIKLCEEALQKDGENTAHYLNLGKILLQAGNRDDAIMVFRGGLKYGNNLLIIDELNKLATRTPPVLSFLHRNNPINKYLGIFLKKLGIR